MKRPKISEEIPVLILNKAIEEHELSHTEQYSDLKNKVNLSAIKQNEIEDYVEEIIARKLEKFYLAEKQRDQHFNELKSKVNSL